MADTNLIDDHDIGWWVNQARQFQAELNTVNPARDAADAKVKDQAAQLAKAAADATAMQAAYAGIMQERAQLNAQVVTTINQRNDLQAQLDTTQQQLAEARKATADAQALAAQQAATLDTFRATLPKISATCADLHTQLAPLIGK